MAEIDAADFDAASRGPIVIAGGSGFIGVSLAGYLAAYLAAAGKTVVILSRHAPQPRGPWRHVTWDARTLGEWRRELDGAAGLVNLVGRSVDCVKTPEHRDEILRSRIEATHVLGLAVRNVNSPPPVWVQMSTAHIYGDPPCVVCDEDSPFGSGFAPEVGVAKAAQFLDDGKRKVLVGVQFRHRYASSFSRICRSISSRCALT